MVSFIMMVKVRELLNPLVLNDCKNKGFMGDSEYRDSDDRLVMGYWEFVDVCDAWLRNVDYLGLDDLVDVDELLDDGGVLEVFNDVGDLCVVKFHYTN